MFDRSLGTLAIARLAYDVGLRNDANQRSSLIDDRNATDFLRAHCLHYRVNIIALRAGRQIVRAHHITHAARAILALGNAANRNVAIGDDADQSLVGVALNDGNHADVFAAHHLSGLTHGCVGSNATRIFSHDVLNSHCCLQQIGSRNQVSAGKGYAQSALGT